MGRPRTIDRSAILRVSLELADEQGLQAVTLQAVARRLGVTAMSLYGHIANKAALLDGIVEELLSEFPLPDAELPWDERLARIGRAARDSARRHPDVFPLLLTRSAATPGAHRVRQAVFAALLDAGLSITEVNRAERLLSTMVVGFATSEVSGRFGQSAADIEADYAYLEETLRKLITSTTAPGVVPEVGDTTG
ncbi:TetR/AcrR family transcriptional regulator [Embleya sp. NPDC001921]